jgi:hypothetical protein
LYRFATEAVKNSCYNCTCMSARVSWTAARRARANTCTNSARKPTTAHRQWRDREPLGGCGVQALHGAQKTGGSDEPAHDTVHSCMRRARCNVIVHRVRSYGMVRARVRAHRCASPEKNAAACLARAVGMFVVSCQGPVKGATRYSTVAVGGPPARPPDT